MGKNGEGVAISAVSAVAVIALMGGGASGEVQGTAVELRGNWFYVDGERFFVKGVCFFENHEVDGKFERSSLEVLDHEFQRIKEAGFNAIRSQLNAKELALAKKHGLMVVQAANHLYFSSEYGDAERRREEETLREIMTYSKRHDNILYYMIDNEPEIAKGIYRQGEKALLDFHGALIRTVKEVHSGARVSMASYPPGGFMDHSLYDVVSLNLYPFCTSCRSAGYEGYAQWFKERHAGGKPLVISEYGWEAKRGEEGFAPAMIELLDDQIAAGATGSFFYTWRAFGKDGEADNLWLGIVPNAGGREDYKRRPRPVYEDFRRYFEAVILEPRKNTVATGSIPVEIYGTDRTAAVEAEVEGEIFALERTGRYWWKTQIPVRPEWKGKKTLMFRSKDRGGKILTEKRREIWAGEKKEALFVDIDRSTETLAEGDAYHATITVSNAEGAKASRQPLKLEVNQSGESLWTSQLVEAETDESGEYAFTWKNLAPGYFTLSAGPGFSEAPLSVHADVDTVRVERSKP